MDTRNNFFFPKFIDNLDTRPQKASPALALGYRTLSSTGRQKEGQSQEQWPW